MVAMAETRWLTDDEQVAWRRLIAVTTLLPYELDAQLQRDAELTHFEYWVLAMLSESPGPGAAHERPRRPVERLPVARLARRRQAGAHAGTSRGERSAADGRGNVARLTDAGFARLREVAPGHVETVRSPGVRRADARAGRPARRDRRGVARASRSRRRADDADRLVGDATGDRARA